MPTQTLTLYPKLNLILTLKLMPSHPSPNTPLPIYPTLVTPHHIHFSRIPPHELLPHELLPHRIYHSPYSPSPITPHTPNHTAHITLTTHTPYPTHPTDAYAWVTTYVISPLLPPIHPHPPLHIFPTQPQFLHVPLPYSRRAIFKMAATNVCSCLFTDDDELMMVCNAGWLMKHLLARACLCNRGFTIVRTC